jgi:alpha-tubulin suppressor-like RCC1 family protein
MGLGLRRYGRLGDGTTVAKSSPVQIGSLTDWAYVFAGYQHSHAIKTDGTLWSWGSNNVGRLGDGTLVNKSSPVQIGSLTDWDSIIKFSTGSSSVEAIKTDNTLWKWGAGSIVDDAKVLSPVLIGSNYTKLSGGLTFTIAINADGELWAWGGQSFW